MQDNVSVSSLLYVAFGRNSAEETSTNRLNREEYSFVLYNINGDHREVIV